MAATQSAIVWSLKFLPGTTDNFISNEIVVKGITAAQIWEKLNDVSQWTSYYNNCSDITFPESGPRLRKGDHFKFSTFGFEAVCVVDECVAPQRRDAGRLAWVATGGSGPEDKIEVCHAWLIEDIEGGRVRVLTQESQIGKPVAHMAVMKPNRMLLGHQDWLEGLVKAVRGEPIGETNLQSISS